MAERAIRTLVDLVNRAEKAGADSITPEMVDKAAGKHLDNGEVAALQQLAGVLPEDHPARRRIVELTGPPEQGGLPRADRPLSFGERSRRVSGGGLAGMVVGAGAGFIAGAKVGATGGAVVGSATPATPVGGAVIGALVCGLIGAGIGFWASGPED